MHTGPGTENLHFYQKQTNLWTGSGSCFDLKHGSPMFRMFRKPVSALDEKNNKQLCDSESCSRFTKKKWASGFLKGVCTTKRRWFWGPL
jgi:hypothetical protein